MFISRGTTKSRQVPGPSYLLNVVQTWPDGHKVHEPVWSASLDGTQITESDGNRWPPPKGGDLSDYGSEFYSRKTEVLPLKFAYQELHLKRKVSNDMPPCNFDVTGNYMIANAFQSPYSDLYSGPTGSRIRFLCNFPDLSSSRQALEVKGSIAVAACNPGNQIAAAASAVGELLQDVPRIPGVALWKARLQALETVAASGDEFLNFIFGISPTLGDMTSFLKASHKVDKLVNQFIRDSGRSVRRSFHFPKEMTDETTTLIYSSPAGNTSTDNGYSPSPFRCLPTYKTMRRRVVERDIWFSGAFTYHLPGWYETGDREARIRLTAQLFGAKPDFNTLWQLTPWSWAVDWFSNAGSFVKNLSSLINYGTVLRYGYVMETTTVTDTYFAGDMTRVCYPGYEGVFLPPYPAIHPVTLRTTTKKRIQANPFGFGLSWDSLSSVQKAIVAALGITRVVR